MTERGSGPNLEPLLEALRGLLQDAVKEAVREELAAQATGAEPPEWLDSKGAAAILGVHPRTVTKLARSGELPSRRIGKLYRFQRKDVLSWLERVA